MGLWQWIVNALVFVTALIFAFIGARFVLMPLVGFGGTIEGGPGWDKAVVGLLFLLAAAPMFYYVFSKNARIGLSRLGAGRGPPTGEGKQPPSV